MDSEFKESVRKFSDNKNYRLTNLLLKIHFLIKPVQKVNKELKEKKQIFRVDFSYDLCLFFIIKPSFIEKNNGTIMMMQLFLNIV